MFKNLSLEALGISGRGSEIIELALSHGFKGLELDLVDFAEQVKAQGFAKASRLITSARLKVGSFAVRVELDSPEQKPAELDPLKEQAQLAEQLGCPRATLMIEPGSDTRPYHENFEYHRRRIAEIADLLAPHKIRLGVGFLAPTACRAGRVFQFIRTADELLQLLRTIGSSNLGLALDCWHWHLGGGNLESVRALGVEKIVTVVLADADPQMSAADAQLSARRLPGDGGAVDIAALLAILAEMRYDGPVTPAPDPSQFAGQGRDKIVKSTAMALEQVWKAAGLNTIGKPAPVSGR